MNKRRIIISAVTGTIALSVISLSLSLAWYASSDRLLVDTIDITINSGDHHLFVSTSPDKETFKEKLEKDELLSVEEFAPVSTMYKKAWMDEKKDTPIFYDNSSTTIPSNGVPELTAATQGYYQQKLYFSSDMNLDYFATLSGVDSIFKADETANLLRAQALKEQINDLSEEEIKAKLDNLVNSLRISILVPDEEYYGYYIVDPTKASNDVTYLAGRLDNDKDGYFDTYEVRNENNEIIEKEVIYGEISNRDVISYKAPTGETISDIDYFHNENHFFGNSFNAKSKGTAYTVDEEKLDEEALFAEEGALSLEEVDSYDTPLRIPLRVGQVTEVILSIYVEGWDLDCYNATMGASFISTLSFKLLRGI